MIEFPKRERGKVGELGPGNRAAWQEGLMPLGTLPHQESVKTIFVIAEDFNSGVSAPDRISLVRGACIFMAISCH